MRLKEIRDSCDIILLVKFNVEFPRQVMDFAVEYTDLKKK